MDNRESYIFWRLAYSLISDHGYRIIQLFENQKELWLEKLENKKAPIIRMLNHDLAWSNAMQRDIEFTASNGERLRKQIGKNEIHVLNILISEYPPVDDYEFRLSQPFVFPDSNKTTVTSILLTNELGPGLDLISEKLEKEINFPVNETYLEQDVEKIKNATLHYAIKTANEEKELFSSGKPLLTYVFIFIQLAVFFWLELHGGSTSTSTLIKYGAKVNELIYQGEWWRFITPVFLHIGLLHLLMNSLSLYYLGTAVEQIFGRIRFLLIYLFAGITGFIASFIFSSNLSAGASGAIFGCFGALLYFGSVFPKLFYRTMGMNLIVVLGINLVFGFSSSGIDNAGHLGGLVGGFLAAGIVHFPKKKRWLWQFIFLIASAAIIGGSLTYGFSSAAKADDEYSYLIVAQEYVNKGKYDQAYHVLKDAEANGVNLSEKTYFLLSFIEIKKNMLTNAKTHLEKAIKLDPEFDEAYFNLALINMEEGDLVQAKVNAEKAAKLKPEHKQYNDLVVEINRSIKRD